MNFYIRQGSTEPILKLQLIDDSKNDKTEFNNILESSTLTFEMFNTETNEYIIIDGECYLTHRLGKFNNQSESYFIAYNFTKDQTSKKGIYEGKININYEDGGLLIVPIQEKLFIHII